MKPKHELITDHDFKSVKFAGMTGGCYRCECGVFLIDPDKIHFDAVNGFLVKK